jgi:hypothetical protein
MVLTLKGEEYRSLLGITLVLLGCRSHHLTQVIGFSSMFAESTDPLSLEVE